MARPTKLRIAAATLFAATTTVALSAWIVDASADPAGRLASRLAAGGDATVLSQHGGDRHARVVTGDHAHSAAVAAAEAAGAACQTRTGYLNADRSVLDAEVSRYSTTRCDLDQLGISIYQWWAGQRPQYGFDRAVPVMPADGASIVVAPSGAGFGRQETLGDTLEQIARRGESALAAQGGTGADLDCGTGRVGLRETSADCVATSAEGVLLPARVDFGGPGLPAVTLGEQPVQVR